jgi:hypothetical protein
MSQRPNLMLEWEPWWTGVAASWHVLRQRSYVSEWEDQDDAFIHPGIPVRVPALSIAGEFVFIMICLLLLPSWVATAGRSLDQRLLPRGEETVIYFKGYLPAIHDRDGAQRGRSGLPGGTHVRAEQAIRIARAEHLRDAVVDVASLDLPRSAAPVDNLVSVAPAPPTNALARLKHALPALPDPAPAVVAPAPSIGRNLSSRGARFKTDLTRDVVPPAPSAVAVLSTGLARAPHPTLPISDVVPPPPDARVAENATSEIGGALPQADAGAVVPPPPALLGSGTKLAGEGGALVGMVVMANPGAGVGVVEGGSGKLTLRSGSGDATGIGGEGAGSGAGSGNSTGAGDSAYGPGASTGGKGYGSGNAVTTGISPGAGGGGAGRGNGPSTGVEIGMVNLPSFGANSMAPPSHASVKLRAPGPPSILIVASARSGGGLNPDLAPSGSRVYTVYVETIAGMAVLQYADPAPAEGFAADLSAPQPLRTELPEQLKHIKAVISCVIDRAGTLQRFRALQPRDSGWMATLLEALAQWRFQPVLRGNEAIEVKAVIGFGVDTQ